MVLEFIPDLLMKLSQVNSFLLMAVFLLFIVLAYKVFQALIKAFIFVVISASFPIVANLMGMSVPLTISSIVWFAILGVTAYLLYASVTGGARIMRMAMRPFRGMFTKKPVQKIIIREKEKS